MGRPRNANSIQKKRISRKRFTSEKSFEELICTEQCKLNEISLEQETILNELLEFQKQLRDRHSKIVEMGNRFYVKEEGLKLGDELKQPGKKQRRSSAKRIPLESVHLDPCDADLLHKTRVMLERSDKELKKIVDRQRIQFEKHRQALIPARENLEQLHDKFREESRLTMEILCKQKIVAPELNTTTNLVLNPFCK